MVKLTLKSDVSCCRLCEGDSSTSVTVCTPGVRGDQVRRKNVILISSWFSALKVTKHEIL